MTAHHAGIKVRLISTERQLSPECILVSMQLFLRGEPYYADVIGLSDHVGVAQSTFAQIDDDFRHDQAVFPMDYKVPLAQCDSTIELIVLGGQEFEGQAESIASNPLVAVDVREMFRRAKNRLVQSARIRFDFDPMMSVDVVAEIPLRSRPSTK